MTLLPLFGLLLICVQAPDQPVVLSIEPPQMTLHGRAAEAQLMVTARYADGSIRDVTRDADLSLSDLSLATVSKTGWIMALHDGQTSIVAKFAGVEAHASLALNEIGQSHPQRFLTEVLPALSKAGCNQGACHGTPTGKNGFRLSLRGYDAKLDFLTLTREVSGRRANPFDPESSLLLLKGTGVVAHQGGPRMTRQSLPYRILRDWIANGLPPEAVGSPKLAKLEVWPSSRILDEPARTQQLVVHATFSDGTTRDVTRLARYTSSDEMKIKVEDDGLIRKAQQGEATVLISYLDQVTTSKLTFLEPVGSFVWSNPPHHNEVDALLSAKWKLLRIDPSPLCDDSTFLRRVFLDVIGVLPTPPEVLEFLTDTHADKRARVIDSLLQRPEYVDFWTLKWADRLGCNQRFVGFKGAYSYHRWIRDQVASNVPFDQFARAIITAKGSNYTNPSASFYRRIRTPEDAAESVSQLFLGVRLQCARCHNHVAERWTQDDYYGFAAFFGQLKYKNGPQAFEIYNKEETVYLSDVGRVVQPRTGEVMAPKLLASNVVATERGADRREQLADWVVNSKNPFFAKAAVNRLWFHVMGRGIVDPVDDLRESNPPASEELLAWLAEDFIAHGYNIKHTLRVILESRTYQLASTTTSSNAGDSRYFSHAFVRLLTAEQLLDAISSATAVPEKLFHLPPGTRATQIPDGEFHHPFLRGFGQPPRSVACECERASDSTLEQALQVVGGRTIHAKLIAPANRIGLLIAANAGARAIVDEMFLATLSRRPSEEEWAPLVEQLSAADVDVRAVAEDILWSLLNHPEFLFQH